MLCYDRLERAVQPDRADELDDRLHVLPLEGAIEGRGVDGHTGCGPSDCARPGPAALDRLVLFLIHTYRHTYLEGAHQDDAQPDQLAVQVVLAGERLQRVRHVMPGKNERLVMRLVTRASSKNAPRNELDSLVTRLVSSLHSMSAREGRRIRPPGKNPRLTPCYLLRGSG